MSTDLKKLYQDTLLRHSKNPSNLRDLPDAPSSTLRNPLCGDEITVYRESGDKPQVAFTAQACSICIASASMMTQRLASLPLPDAEAYARSFVSHFKDAPDKVDLPGDLEALTGVRAFPSRIRCATLPWEAYLKIPKETSLIQD